MARETKSDETLLEALEVLEFRLAQERYALESRFVQGVHPLKELTRVPCTPRFMVGIVNVRGRIVPVIDLKRFLDLPDRGLTDLHCVILVRGNDCEVGLLADVIVGARSIPLDNMQHTPATVTGVRSECLRGVAPGPLIVLDLERMLSDPRIIVHEEVET